MSQNSHAFIINPFDALVRIDTDAFSQVLPDGQSWQTLPQLLGSAALELFHSPEELFAVLSARLGARTARDLVWEMSSSISAAADMDLVSSVVGDRPCVVTADCDPILLVALRAFLQPHLPQAKYVTSTGSGFRKIDERFWMIIKGLQPMPAPGVWWVLDRDPAALDASRVLDRKNVVRLLIDPAELERDWQAVQAFVEQNASRELVQRIADVCTVVARE